MRKAGRTAVGPVAILAIEQNESRPLLRDSTAKRMLPLTARLVVDCARWSPIRRALIAATESTARGLWACILCRKRYVDERVADALDRGVEAVVLLGAGIDPLGRRLCGVPVYEVDHTSILARRTFATDVIEVPVDFETQDIAEQLARHGYRPGERTMIVWEAVTQYLTEPAVQTTLAGLSAAAPGSELVFTYIRQDFLTGEHRYGAESAHRRFVRRGLWRFGLHPDQVAAFLAEHGWREVEQLGPEEYTARYLVPMGRELPVSPIERCVHAVKA